MIGLVLRIDAKTCLVEVAGARHALPLRGKLFEGRGRSKGLIAVGDRVRVTLAGNEGAIEEILPRSSLLVRKAAGDRGGSLEEREHLIAANISKVIVVASLRDPKFQPELVDRILAGAERAGISAALVLTKADLMEPEKARSIADIYSELGYEVFVTSVTSAGTSSAELDRLSTLVHTNTSVLCGASGIGKSTLLNRIVPGSKLRVGEVSRVKLGRHTTSHTELVPLEGGGHVLDTPGIRGFELFAVEPTEIGALFPEIRDRAVQCAFRDCRHLVEPKCAVRAALERGEIAPSRYESYRAMLEVE